MEITRFYALNVKLREEKIQFFHIILSTFPAFLASLRKFHYTAQYFSQSNYTLFRLSSFSNPLSNAVIESPVDRFYKVRTIFLLSQFVPLGKKHWLNIETRISFTEISFCLIPQSNKISIALKTMQKLSQSLELSSLFRISQSFEQEWT